MDNIALPPKLRRLCAQKHFRKPSIKLVCRSVSLLIVFFAILLTVTRVSAADVNTRRAVRSMLELREDKVVVQQWDISCGAAALATILKYQHGDPVPEKKIAETMLKRTDPLRVKFRGGFSLLDLKRFAESRGFTADGYTEVSLENLIEFGPSIVPVSTNGYHHFVVFRGIVSDQVLLADPGFGNRILTVAQFEEAWVQNMAFVVSRADGKPAPNQLTPKENDFVAPSATALRMAIRPGGLRW